MQKNYGVKFLSFAGALPSKVVTNSDLEKLFDTSDEWIYTRTGIRQRHVVDKNESGLSLSVDAAKQALNKAKIDPKAIDLIIVCTATPDKQYPSMSCMLQGAIGAVNSACFDLSAACSGFIFGMATASQFIYTGQYENVLLVGVDIHSRFIDWSERSVAVLFGDGAGAVVMSSCLAKDDELAGFILHSEADSKLDLTLDNDNIYFTDFKDQVKPDFVKMNGKAVYQFALRVIPEIAHELLDKVNMTTDQVDYLVLHQANQRIIDAVAEKLKLGKDKVVSNIEKVGNTSAASIPLAIADSLASNKIKIPSKMLLIGFGAGLTWGAAIIECNISKI
ncbi:MAG: hypothetical protein A3I68_04815 [Candidatus Melainabacteria bacterium RIFCSPLOWO2_02_FULL_35_15]|nr:MAG: hypothetical protein A3F80_07225 [Candidatus Melainabacteria bacterium RIFCSPLOWO2_12_FULL_35_11]OGI12778.1 MAG: hypothetical protein A3I68_04815 [Candidatus Melainabacteria bacterium RIFCSPLOWO2_02_FULL_35_15]